MAYKEVRRTEGLRSSQGEPLLFTCVDNAVTVPRFDVSGRLRLTLTASQTFGSTYLFVRLLKNLSGPLIRCDSQKPPGEKSKRFARLILRRLSAYCLQTI